MKKLMALLLALGFMLCLVSCSKEAETAYIMVDGVLYEIQYAMPAEIDPSAIVGHVEHYTEAIPTKDGGTNISEDLIGEPYAKVEGGIALLYQNEWWLCTEESSK